MAKIYRTDNGGFSGLKGKNTINGNMKMSSGIGSYNLTHDGKRILQTLSVYEPLPGTDNLYGYIDRNGNGRIVLKLVGGEFYPLGENKYPQKRLIVEGEDKIRFLEDGKELTLEEMILSQLEGDGEYVYFMNPITDKVDIAHKSYIERLIAIDSTLNEVYSELEQSKK